VELDQSYAQEPILNDALLIGIGLAPAAPPTDEEKGLAPHTLHRNEPEFESVHQNGATSNGAGHNGAGHNGTGRED
jgi:hypothetical protein